MQSRAFDSAKRPEIAFFGGTFTNLPFDYMVGILEATRPFIQQGHFHSIRVSTRPDALDTERLQTMKQYGVRTVELGAQSMDDEVLVLSNRGHTAKDTTEAVRRLKDFGFKVGLQLMPGLPGDSPEIFATTITKAITLRPDLVRLYPALVLRGTALARFYRAGTYRPLSLDSAVGICTDACMRLESEGIPVIRIGLMSSPGLLAKGQIIAGPWHTAFGFLVRSAIYHKSIAPFLPAPHTYAGVRIVAAKRDIPLLRGYKNEGTAAIRNKSGAKVIYIDGDESLPHGKIRVEGI